MNEYEAQLVAVEQALKNATDEQQREELSALRTNLQELLALTRETETDQTAQEGDILDDELLRLKSELNELEEAAATVGATKNEDEEQQLADLRAKYNALIGEKCSAPHEHSWGAVSYHNALICGVDDEVIINSNAVLDVRLRVLYINPTHCEMLPCNYYLEGECRFDEIRCRYSHGALVPGASIKSYIPPDFPRLARNCPVLAKMPDRLWHRGRVLCANFVEQTCRVRLDGQDHKERERDFQFEELYPLIAEEEDEMTSEDSTSSLHDGSSDEIESDMDDLEAAHRSRMVELSLFTFKPTEKLGAWEQYTRGIGSKLMEKMGYIHGTGLGSEGRGIVTPVSAQILPQGRSLDACMELREAANGDKDYFSVERKLKRAQRRQNKANEKAYVRETQRTDVFSFLNGSVLGGSGKSGQQAEPAAKNTKTSDLQQHSTKTLNVETVRVADDIRRKQRDIAKVKQSLDRNATDVQLQKRLHMQLQSQKQELATLQAHEHRLSKEQNTRKNKIFEF